MTQTKYPSTYLIPLLGLTILLLIEGAAVGDGIRAGLDLCYRAIIPSVFPFSVLSAYISRWEGGSSLLTKGFEKVFHLPGKGILPLFIGLFCGFPLGAKAVADGYQQGDYTKEEAERLLCFTNNTGLSFLLLGVGVGMRGSLLDGAILALIQLLTAILVGLLVREPQWEGHTPCKAHAVRSPLPFPQAIRDALFGTLTVCAFVTFFSGLLGVTEGILPPPLQAVLACVLEVGTGTRLATDMTGGILLSAFAISFSGLSVHMQTLSVLGDCDLSLRRYFPMKLVSGCLSLLLALPYFYLFS